MPICRIRKQYHELDRYDRQILQVLQQDGRISNQDLADRIGLSPSPCLRRCARSKNPGLITGYRALLDAKKLGLSLMALIYISMDQHTPERFDHFENEISRDSEVLECLLITGQDADYQIKVVVRDMDAFQELLLNRITRIQGVTGVHSSFRPAEKTLDVIIIGAGSAGLAALREVRKRTDSFLLINDGALRNDLRTGRLHALQGADRSRQCLSSPAQLRRFRHPRRRWR
jgi:Lrp/AsnC family leucine-responsive transcriptional regulator